MIRFKDYNILLENIDTKNVVDLYTQKLYDILNNLDSHEEGQGYTSAAYTEAQFINECKLFVCVCIASDPTCKLGPSPTQEDLQQDGRDYIFKRLDIVEKAYKLKGNISGGKYCVWVIKQFIKKFKQNIYAGETSSSVYMDEIIMFTDEDCIDVCERLLFFWKHPHTFKEMGLPTDIHSYESLDAFLHKARNAQDNAQLQSVSPEDFDIIYGKFDFEKCAPLEGTHKFAAIVNTHTGARALGRGTNWCTALEYSKFFDLYTRDGSKLYVIYAHNKKYQIHFASVQFRDEDDNSIISSNISQSALDTHLGTHFKNSVDPVIIKTIFEHAINSGVEGNAQIAKLYMRDFIPSPNSQEIYMVCIADEFAKYFMHLIKDVRGYIKFLAYSDISKSDAITIIRNTMKIASNHGEASLRPYSIIPFLTLYVYDTFDYILKHAFVCLQDKLREDLNYYRTHAGGGGGAAGPAIAKRKVLEIIIWELEGYLQTQNIAPEFKKPRLQNIISGDGKSKKIIDFSQLMMKSNIASEISKFVEDVSQLYRVLAQNDNSQTNKSGKSG